MLSTYRTEEHGRKEFRERDTDQDREREKERRQKEKERLKRRDEERQRRRERLDAESSCRKQEDEVRKERERNVDKKCENLGEPSEKAMKSAKEERKDEKRERLRNKVRTTACQTISPSACLKLLPSSLQDRPAIQLYQPGARSRNRTTGAGPDSAPRKPDAETEKASDKAED